MTLGRAILLTSHRWVTGLSPTVIVLISITRKVLGNVDVVALDVTDGVPPTTVVVVIVTVLAGRESARREAVAVSVTVTVCVTIMGAALLKVVTKGMTLVIP